MYQFNLMLYYFYLGDCCCQIIKFETFPKDFAHVKLFSFRFSGEVDVGKTPGSKNTENYAFFNYFIPRLNLLNYNVLQYDQFEKLDALEERMYKSSQ